MNILFIIPEEYGGPKYGGVTAYTQMLAQALQKRRHHVTIITPGSRYRIIKEYGATIHTLPLWYPHRISGKIVYKAIFRFFPIALDWIRWSISVYQFVRSHNHFNVIEAPEWGASTLLLSLLPHQNIVVRLHRSTMQYWRDNNLPVTLEFIFIDLLERIAAFTAKYITSPTRYMVDKYPALLWWHRRKGHIRVIPNGVAMRPRNISMLTKKNTTILFVGRLEVGKGCDVLLRAMRLFHAQFPRFRLVMIGEDTLWYTKEKWEEYTPHLRHIIHTLRMDEYVQILPKQPHHKLEGYYHHCVMFVLPSLGHENCSMALLDALRRNMPVVASSAGGTPEVMHGYSRGKLFRSSDHEQLADQMIAMMRDIRHTEAKSKQSVVNRFDIRITAKMTESLFLCID